MILQTGGRAMGATSTRSCPASRARRRASLVGVGPTLLSFSSIRKIGEILICSLWRKFVEIALFSGQNIGHQAPAGLAHRGRTTPPLSLRDVSNNTAPQCPKCEGGP